MRIHLVSAARITKNEVNKMSCKTLAETRNVAMTVALSMLLVSATLVGCARDATSPFASMNSSSAAMEQARKDIYAAGPQPTIQQTAYEADIPAQKWHDSLTTAIAEAQSNDKLILADFTGSDWCHYCVKLKDEVFSTPEFKSWAGENVVLLEVDSPKRTQLPQQIREQNEMLKSRFNITSFPTVLLLDTDGNVLGKMGYERGKSPAQWVQLAESQLQQSASKRISVANGQSDKQQLR